VREGRWHHGRGIVVSTEYCGDFDATKFNASNNIDLWVFISSETELVASFTPTFDEGTYFPMVGGVYLTSAKTPAFVAGVLFEDGSYATIQGTAKADRTGAVGSLSGTFIQNSVFDVSCFSSGKFKSTQRLL
jgi:hypothetical protein